MRSKKFITVHCSGTECSTKYTAETIRKWHMSLGWTDIGYHFVITPDGLVHDGRNIDAIGAHVRGHNENNIGICLIGGVDSAGESTNNFTINQFSSLRRHIIDLISTYNISQDNILGHRDWYIIDNKARSKDCPCFDVQTWWKL